jgi:hypothetical protein
MKVVRRESLLKLGKDEKLTLINNYSMSEEDNESIRMRNVSIPVIIGTVDIEDKKEGFWYVPEQDFKSKNGRAWENIDGTITMVVHKEKSMTFRVG